MWLSPAEKPEHVGPQGTERSPGSVPSFHRWAGRGPGKGRKSLLVSLREFLMELELLQRKRCLFVTLMCHPFSTQEVLEAQRGVGTSYPKTPRELGAELGLVHSAANPLHSQSGVITSLLVCPSLPGLFRA